MEKNAKINRIRKLMNELGLSQTALAKDMTDRGYPITQSAISHILATGKISIETLTFMSNAYNKPLDWLTGNKQSIDDTAESSPSVESLQQTIETLTEMLNMWKDHYQNLKDTTDDLRKEAQLLRAIVKKAHDDGTLIIQNNSGNKR